VTDLVDDPKKVDGDADETRIDDRKSDDSTRVRPKHRPSQSNHNEPDTDTRLKNRSDATRVRPGSNDTTSGARRSLPGNQDSTRFRQESTRLRQRPTSSALNRRSSSQSVRKPSQPPPKGLPFGGADNQTPAIPQPRPIQKITLKNRFVLDETLGVGGMGVVYKAIDKRKVEAKDRNPYLAVKILSEDFRQHPDAFMALQREARKSQSIAHPNIVNVHDFDRDGDTVFMTMEYMEGTPLDQLLRENRGVGLTKEHATRILKDMCAALEHAHKEYIIHADFKPGNIFVTNSGVTKVFDFGIARAVAQADRQTQHGDKSIFDAETLGALTPAYASPEMLRGASPTIQDDVFALGCVAYEMFAGEHPFNRVQADQAMEQKIKPKRIKSLSKQQWKALKRALAFSREERTSSVYEFLWEFTSVRKSGWKKWLAAAVVIGVGGGVYMQYFYKQELTPEQYKAQLEQQIKIDIIKERLNELVANPEFTPLWESDVWGQVQSGRRVLGLKDQWLLEKETQIVGLYLSQISDNRQKQRFSVAQAYLDNAGRYRGYEDRLDRERVALNDAIADIKEQQRLARERQRRQEDEEAQRRAAARAAAAAKAQSKPARPAVREPVREEKDVFALAMNNVKQQLRCTRDINTRNLEGAVLQAKSIDEKKFRAQSRQVVTSLAVCIEKIGRTDSNRAEDLKTFALGLFPGNQHLARISIKPVDPCNVSMAGLGARGKKGTCRDRFFSGGYGPRMVVVPGEGKLKPFAISQYEVSVEQMNEYCRNTRNCQVRNGANASLPVTNISFTQAREYARWLSNNSGYRYRIPRQSEWLYAARANGSELDANRNCSLESRGIKKGETLEEVTTGKKNKWGLVNYVGNAQEWVLKNNRDLFAVGGSHTDPFRDCTVEKQRSHDGKPDAITGFRLVRELRG
jgi:tRNA A-37 threonylcarbamoyl transferase component Bud32